ncbi:YigZ family protein [Clostridium sp. UBA4548]|uniref:YigZ family protein n=1 Tax=Clostridium sp. UBA4548 TaxID=1946361 RepID=UPI0025B7F32B|nr:YigZ family protein [Clostridium sp. UBA4548]
MSYFTVRNEAVAEFEEKKSVFIGHVKRVHTEEEAKEFINKVKGQHKEARHNVYAYAIGVNKGIQRYSDDGEPQGTGGIPVLEVLKKSDLTDIVVVVTRYFGGILLGTGGLARAYSKGASLAIGESGVVEKVLGVPLRITIDYELLGKIQYVCSTNQWHIEDTVYTDKVEILMYCESTMIKQISDTLTENTNGKLVISEGDEEYFFKQDNRLYVVN